MGEFEKCIKELYPKDGERIANKYPDMSYEELYWSEFDVWQFQQSKIEQLEKENAHLAEMNKRYLGKMQEQQDQIAELKKDLCAHKIEHFEMYGRINYAHHCFLTMDRDQFLKNIEAIICGRLRHPEFSFDKTRIKALRGES